MPLLLGQYGSCSVARWPVELLENILQNLRNNLPPEIVVIVLLLITACRLGNYRQFLLLLYPTVQLHIFPHCYEYEANLKIPFGPNESFSKDKLK